MGLARITKNWKNGHSTRTSDSTSKSAPLEAAHPSELPFPHTEIKELHNTCLRQNPSSWYAESPSVQGAQAEPTVCLTAEGAY